MFDPMNQNRINIGMAGDVMIGRGVDTAISRHGYAYAWGDLLPLIKSMDATIINLETTLTNGNRKVEKTFNFKASPDKIHTLTEAGITAVNLANNHILDYSEEGLSDTIRELQKAGIKYTGAGMNMEEACKPAILVCQNIRIGLLGFTDNEPGWQAGKTKCGVNYIDIRYSHDRERALEAIRELKEETDFVIISLHWGPNMNERPNRQFIEFAHLMISRGADIIHGHSAHIFQGIEVYRNKLILYDTGDFVDDYVVDPFLKNDHSFFFIIELVKNRIYRLRLVPVLISHYQVNQAVKKESEWSLQRMQQLSSEFGTTITETGEVHPAQELQIE